MIFSRSEINIRMNVPAWEGQEVQIASEQDEAFTQKGILYLDGRQTRFHLTKQEIPEDIRSNSGRVPVPRNTASIS